LGERFCAGRRPHGLVNLAMSRRKRKIGNLPRVRNGPMYRIASRIATVGFVVYLLGVGYPAQAQAEERLREMPKVGADPQGGQVEQLPLPHELGIETRIWTESGPATFCERPLNCTRINRYEIWQFYEVGHQG